MDVLTAIRFSISRVVPSVLSSANTMRYGMASNATDNWATSGGGFPRSLNVGTIRAIDGADPGFMDSWDPSASVWSIERLASVLTLDYLYIYGFSESYQEGRRKLLYPNMVMQSVASVHACPKTHNVVVGGMGS
jgi:hypothetical protein